jgi:hypothetical protein
VIGVHEHFGADVDETELKAAQDRICGGKTVRAIAFEQIETPPLVAHVYLQDVRPGKPTDHIFAGTMWLDENRWPTVEEIAAALGRWRGNGSPVFNVLWWKEKEPGDAVRS